MVFLSLCDQTQTLERSLQGLVLNWRARPPRGVHVGDCLLLRGCRDIHARDMPHMENPHRRRASALRSDHMPSFDVLSAVCQVSLYHCACGIAYNRDEGHRCSIVNPWWYLTLMMSVGTTDECVWNVHDSRSVIALFAEAASPFSVRHRSSSGSSLMLHNTAPGIR